MWDEERKCCFVEAVFQVLQEIKALLPKPAPEPEPSEEVVEEKPKAKRGRPRKK